MCLYKKKKKSIELENVIGCVFVGDSFLFQGSIMSGGFMSRAHGGDGGISVSWSCNTVCTFVNVHENTVDDTSVVVNRSADRSTLTYYRAQEQTPVQTGHTS